MRATFRAALAGGLFALALSGPVQAAEQIVEIVGYRFIPEEVHVKPGDTVTWVNREKRVSHSILFLGTGKESERIFPDERWSREFSEPGRHEYRCGPHPEMKAVVVVAD